MVQQILLLLLLFIIAFGIIFRDVELLIELIRDFKRSRAVKSVNFTDEELEMLYNILSDDFNDLSSVLDDENLYNPNCCDSIFEVLNDIKAMMLKISDSGLFS